MSKQAISVTYDNEGRALTETLDGCTMPADFSFSTVNGFVHGFGVHFEDLQNLCLGMANEIDRMRDEIKLLRHDQHIQCLERETDRIKANFAKLHQGEYICRKCGIRQGGEKASPEF